jgi:type II secretory pathway component PulC
MNTYKLLKNIEYFFLLLTILCLGYIGRFFLSQRSNVDPQVLMSTTKNMDVNTKEEAGGRELKPYSFYAQQIDSRDIFAAVKQVNNVEKVVATEGLLPDSFKVVGIVFAKPVQVIIENQKDHQTYFITEDNPVNGISIKNIVNNQIFLSYQGQTIKVNAKENKVNAASAEEPS